MEPFARIERPTRKSSQGQKANHQGQDLENRVKWLLVRNEYIEVPRGAPLPSYPLPKYFIHQHDNGGSLRSIYRQKMSLDFFVFNAEKWPEGLGIECKSQYSNGSVDEKFPYTILSLNGMTFPTILIVDGDGPKQGALTYCAEQNSDRFLFVHGYRNFEKKVEKEGLL